MSVTTILAPAIKLFATHVNTSSLVDSVVIPPSGDDNNDSSFNNNGRFAFLYKLKQDKLANIRPLGEFFDKNRFNYTASFQLVSQRWK
jgi:hypothetical protein